MQGDREEASVVIQARGEIVAQRVGVAMEMWKNGQIWALFREEDNRTC